MGKKGILLLFVIGIIYIGASALGALVSSDKVVRSTAIETIKIGASGAPIPKKTTPKPVVTVRPKATVTPRATTRAKTTTPAKATIKPTARPVSSGAINQIPKTTNTSSSTKTTPANKINYSYSVTVGGSTASSISIYQGGGAIVSVKENGFETNFSISLGTGNGLLYTSGKNIRAKYDKSITGNKNETITIRYTNRNTGKVANISKTIIINPHKTHSFGAWKSGPSNGTQERTCSVCGYVDVKIPFSVTISSNVINIMEGSTQTITINARGYGEGKLTKTFSSSNTSVATVTSSGVITAKKYGTATITARVGIQGTTTYKTATCTVNVLCTHKRTEQSYISVSENKHRVTRRCTTCRQITLLLPQEKLEAHTWGTNWVGDTAAGRYTHMCTKCKALGGGIKYSPDEIETASRHTYRPSEFWSRDDNYHWRECTYPNCSMRSHTTINSNLPANAQFGAHEPAGGGADANVCICGQSLVQPCEHEADGGMVVRYDANSTSGGLQPSREGHYIVYYCTKCSELLRSEFISHIVGTRGNISSNNEKHFCSDCRWEQDHSGSSTYTTDATCGVAGNVYKVMTCDFCSQNVSNKVGELLGLNHVYSSDAETNIPFNLSDGTSITIIYSRKTPDTRYALEDDMILTDSDGNPSRTGEKYHHNSSSSASPEHWGYKWCYRCGIQRTESPCTITYASSDSIHHYRLCRVCGREELKPHEKNENRSVIAKKEGDTPYSETYINKDGVAVTYTIRDFPTTTREPKSLAQRSTNNGGYHTALYQCAQCGTRFKGTQAHNWVVQDAEQTHTGLIFIHNKHKYGYVCTMCNYTVAKFEEDCDQNNYSYVRSENIGAGIVQYYWKCPICGREAITTNQAAISPWF
jgi:hypothetical protein